MRPIFAACTGRERHPAPSVQQIPGHGRIAGAFGLLLVSLIAALILGGTSGGGSRATAARQQPAQATPAGYLLIAGGYFAPPYTVTVTGTRVFVNDHLVADTKYTPAPATVQAIDDTDPGLSVDELVELGRRYFVSSTTDADGPAGRTATAVYLRDLPAAPDVQEDPSSLLVTSATGDQARLMLDAPSWGVAPADGGSGAATRVAALDQSILDDGVMIITSAGTLLMLPRDRGVLLLQQALDLQRQGLDIATRTARLSGSLRDPIAVNDVVSNLQPTPDLVDRLNADAPPPAVPPAALSERAVSDSSLKYLDSTDPSDQHPNSDTPGSLDACVWSSIPELDAGLWVNIAQAMRSQNYAVTTHIATNSIHHNWILDPNAGRGFRVEDTPAAEVTGGATVESFVSCTGGPIEIEAHGGPDGSLALERYRTRPEAITARNNLLVPPPNSPGPLYSAADLQIGSSPDGFWYVVVTPAFIKTKWRDTDSIVYLLACNGEKGYAAGWQQTYHDATPATPGEGPIGPREFLGYTGTAAASKAAVQAVDFWNEAAATPAALIPGASRPVRTAFHLVSANYPLLAWHQRTALTESRVDTVLSPAVGDALPRKGDMIAVSDQTYSGVVIFDAAVDVSRSPANRAITFGGCVRIVEAHWDIVPGDTAVHRLLFTYLAVIKGSGTFTVVAANLQARNNHNLLDGNTAPSGTDHVAPNKDNYTWDIGCRTIDLTPTTTAAQPLPTTSTAVTPVPAPTIIFHTPSPTPSPAAQTPTPPSAGQPIVPPPPGSCQKKLSITPNPKGDTPGQISLVAQGLDALAPFSVFQGASNLASGTTDVSGTASSSVRFTPRGVPGPVTYVIATSRQCASGDLIVVPPGQGP